MANRRVRKLRLDAHSAFDPIWQEKLLTRFKAYVWLSVALGVTEDACHISQLTEAQLRDVIRLSNEYLAENREALLKRKEKKNDQRTKRNLRENRGAGRAIAERKARPKR
jgi:hypothetical protein